jgi:imidazole glycerol-phosphate synthase subunit HisF
MLKKRIIPCLDIKDGRTVKGVHFEGLRDAGDPLELAKKYVQDGADELVFLDISATHEKRKTLVALVEKIAREINIPFTVGGGIKAIEDVSTIISAGADKVSINTSAVLQPLLIKELASCFGSQCIVLAIDVEKIHDEWYVFSHGGTTQTAWLAIDWAQKGVALGAGEILLTSMNNDGTKSGFALDITQQVAQSVNVPIIASGGAGSLEDFDILFKQTNATAGLAASIFHYGEIDIPSLKSYLHHQNIAVRLT